MKEYKKLDKSETYDNETVEELAEAINELHALDTRANFLRELIEENKELHQFIWTTREGKALAHHQIKDDHFKNILLHIVASGRIISKALKSEARRRNIEIPAEHEGMITAFSKYREAIEAEVLDDDMWDNQD